MSQDYIALEWVKGEIQETLQQAQQSLEAYGENPQDKSRLKFCFSYLHQVRGTLQMVEFFGAALLAEEMEAVAECLANGSLASERDGLQVLMQAIIQLPHYLDHVKVGRRDLPIVLLPILNELRSARGESLLSETALFSPRMVRRAVLRPEQLKKFRSQEFQQWIRKIRQMFQTATLQLFQGKSPEVAKDYLIKVFSKLHSTLGHTPSGVVWQPAMAFSEWLAGQRHVPASAKQHLRDIDLLLKTLILEGPDHLNTPSPDDLVKNLLFYVARTRVDGPSIRAVQEAFALANALPSEAEIQKEREALAGPDRATISQVLSALIEEITTIKDKLDLAVRDSGSRLALLTESQPAAKQVCDTMAMLGLGMPRDVIQEQLNLIGNMVSSGQCQEQQLSDMAGALLYVEATLANMIREGKLDSRVAAGSLTEEQKAVLREARNGLEQVKDAIIAYVANQWDAQELNQVPRLLRSIAGSLGMIPLEAVSSLLNQVAPFVEGLINDNARIDWNTLDNFADVLSGIEYYIERYSENPHNAGDSILERAAQALRTLPGYVPEVVAEPEPKVAPVAKQPAPVVKQPEPAPVVKQPEPAPVVKQPEPAPVVKQPEPAPVVKQPEPAAVVKQPEPAPVAKPAPAPVVEETDDLIDDEIIEIFLEEAEEVTGTLDEYWPIYKANTSDSEALTTVRRAFHTLKGSGRMVHALVIGELAWSIENMFNRVIDKTIRVSDDLLNIVEHVLGVMPVLIDDFRCRRSSSVDTQPLMDYAFDIAAGKAVLPLSQLLAGAGSVSSEPHGRESSDTGSDSSPDQESDSEEGERSRLADQQDERLQENNESEEPPLVTVTDRMIDDIPVITEHGIITDLPVLTAEAATPASVFEVPVVDVLADDQIAVADLVDDGAAVAEITDDEPVAEITIDEPVAEITIDEPVAEIIVDEPVAEIIVDEPVAEITVDEPVAEINVDEPVAEIIVDEPVAEINVDEPVANTILDTPVMTPAPTAVEAVSMVHAYTLDEDDDDDASLLEVFVQEAKGHLEVVNEFVAESISSNYQNPMGDQVQRALHTLKGSAHMAGISAIANLASPLERLLKEFRAYQVANSKDLVDLVRDGASMISSGLRDKARLHSGMIGGYQTYMRRIDLIERTLLLPIMEEAERAENVPNPQAISQFLAQGMDSLLDADQLIRSWQKGDESVLDALCSDLSEVNRGAAQAEQPRIAELCQALFEFYREIRATGEPPKPEWLDLAFQGQEELLNMMDFLAAGQELNVPEVLESISAVASQLAVQNVLRGAPATADESADEGLDALNALLGGDDDSTALSGLAVEAEPLSDALQATELATVSVESAPRNWADALYGDDESDASGASSDPFQDPGFEVQADPALMVNDVAQPEILDAFEADTSSIDMPGNSLATETLAESNLSIDHGVEPETTQAPIELDGFVYGDEEQPSAYVSLIDSASDFGNVVTVADEQIELVNEAADEAVADDYLIELVSEPAADTGTDEHLIELVNEAADEAVADDYLIELVSEPHSDDSLITLIGESDAEPVLSYEQQEPSPWSVDAEPQAGLAAAEAESSGIDNDAMIIELELDDVRIDMTAGESDAAASTERLAEESDNTDEIPVVSAEPVRDDSVRVLEQMMGYVAPKPAFSVPQTPVAPAPIVVQEDSVIPVLPQVDVLDVDVLDVDEVDPFSTGDAEHDAEVDEILEIFLEESEEIIESVENTLTQWRAEPENLVSVARLQRDLHTLKGGARMAEQPAVAELCHELETLYERINNGRLGVESGLFALLQAAHDDLGGQLDSIRRRRRPASAASIMASLTAYMSGKPAEVPQAPSSAPAEAAQAPVETPLVEIVAPVPVDVLDITPAVPQPAAASYQVQSAPMDESDREILEIFLEEAQELQEALERTLHEWKSEPQDSAAAAEAQRVLHTLKGGARLAGITDLGDIAHQFETDIVQMVRDHKPADNAFFELAYQRQDSIVRRIEQIAGMLASGDMLVLDDSLHTAAPVPNPELPGVAPTPAAEPPTVEETLPANVVSLRPGKAPVAPVSTPVADVETAALPDLPSLAGLTLPDSMANRKAPQELVKVSADLLDDLVNLAGETSIGRGRLEQQVTDFAHTLEEMEMTLDRLRDQLRRLDIETEAQVLFRQERQGPAYEDFDPLEMDRYSTMQQLSRALVESASDLLDLKDTLANKTRDAETLLLQQSRVNTELQEGLMKTRMVPFQRLVPRLRRIVRQISQELEKQIDFRVVNADGELDRTILERMISPLEHMVRNAVDHGVESPEDRRRAGKPETGIIELEVSREGGDVVLTLRDDGRGIRRDAVRKKAIERGLLEPDAEISDHELMQFILQAGFSTAKNVTQISGRGVGLDVVSTEIKQMGGAVEIASEEGRGTSFVVRLPFTVSVNRALMVRLGDDLYAVPLNNIQGIVRVSVNDLQEFYSKPAVERVYQYAGRDYRLDYLGVTLENDSQPKIAAQNLPLPVLLVQGAGSRPYALQVDSLLGSREIVVKTLGPQFAAVMGVSGGTILGDGSVVIILDLPALIRARSTLEYQQAKLLDSRMAEQRQEKLNRQARILVVDDSVTVRKVTTRLLERNGFEVMTASDGMDAMATLQDHKPDLMLLDIEMPRMDGFEVASLVRHDSRLRDIPIIMITSRTGDKHRDRAMSLGVSEYMGKPFQEDKLLGAINHWLGREDS